MENQLLGIGGHDTTLALLNMGGGSICPPPLYIFANIIVTVFHLYSKFCNFNSHHIRHIVAKFHVSIMYQGREINIFLSTGVKNF